MTVFPPASEVGKPAVTHWRVIEAFGPVTWVECILETGRTHQIRAHMKSIGHPLFADERYGGMEILRGQPTAAYKAFVRNAFELCPRQALHARTLGFQHPRTHEDLFFESTLPEDLTRVTEKWRSYARTLL
jgi:23S rRNA pseudouridine1911/1915/1917 synthase